MLAGMEAPRLETERLIVRGFVPDDVDAVTDLMSDGEALAAWGAPLSRDEVLVRIDRNLARYQADGFGRCAIVLRQTGELVGDCGLVRTEVEGTPELELGWIVRRDLWGRGIATEAARAWCDFAFGALGLDRIVSMISEGNVASRRVAEKLGMAVERTAIWGEGPMLEYVLTRPLA
jgi:RimJ/RimL family protein N-acetyltransferase